MANNVIFKPFSPRNSSQPFQIYRWWPFHLNLVLLFNSFGAWYQNCSFRYLAILPCYMFSCVDDRQCPKNQSASGHHAWERIDHEQRNKLWVAAKVKIGRFEMDCVANKPTNENRTKLKQCWGASKFWWLWWAHQVYNHNQWSNGQMMKLTTWSILSIEACSLQNTCGHGFPQLTGFVCLCWSLSKDHHTIHTNINL